MELEWLKGYVFEVCRPTFGNIEVGYKYNEKIYASYVSTNIKSDFGNINVSKMSDRDIIVLCISRGIIKRS